jgi:hypothetical protein
LTNLETLRFGTIFHSFIDVSGHLAAPLWSADGGC